MSTLGIEGGRIFIQGSDHTTSYPYDGNKVGKHLSVGGALFVWKKALLGDTLLDDNMKEVEVTLRCGHGVQLVYSETREILHTKKVLFFKVNTVDTGVCLAMTRIDASLWKRLYSILETDVFIAEAR